MTRHTPNWLQAGSYSAALDRDLVAALWPNGASNTGLVVTPQSGMTVQISAGRCAVVSPNNTGSALCTSDAVETVTLAAAPASGTNRIDLIVCQPRGSDWDGSANTDFIFTNVTGAGASTPTAPAVPAGTYCIAQIAVVGGSASVVAGNITDRRTSGLAANTPAVFRIRQALAQAQLNGLNTWAPTIVDEDTDAGYVVGTGIYTVKRPGLWIFSASVQWSGNGTGVRSIGFISSNAQFPGVGWGTWDQANSDPSLAARMGTAIGPCRMNVGDTVNVQVYQSSGGTLNSGVGHFSGQWTGA